MPYPETLGPDGLLRARLDDESDGITFSLYGELDLASADALLARLTELAAATRGDVCLNFADLEFLGSTGIRSIISAHRHLQSDGRRLVLRDVHDAPLRALAITGVLTELHVDYDLIG